MKLAAKILAAILAVLVVLAGAFVALNWAPDVPVAQLTERWAPPPSQFIALEGMEVHVRDEGRRDDPSPILLLHGTSASLHTWEGWVAALAGTRRVITFDLPGYGLTGPAPDRDYTMERYVRFTLALLDKLRVERCILGGNSFGGYVAWVTALAAPQRVDRLILVDAAGYPQAPTSVPIGFRLARMPFVNKLAGYTLSRRMVESSVRNVYGDPSKVTPELVDRYYAITLRAGNRRALVDRFEQAPPRALASRIGQLRLPTLILWGGRDRLTPVAGARQFHRDIAGSEFVIFDDLGHVPHEEDAARTVAPVVKFLARP